jgi:ABC-type glycerol-3-phosphate transport system substrate-binding protein
MWDKPEHRDDEPSLTRRRFVGASLLLPFGASTLLAACGGDDSSGSKQSAKSGGGKESFAGTTITVITRGGMSDQDVWKDATAAWQQRTGGKVTFQVIDFADFDAKYAGFLASKDGSVDVLYTLGSMTSKYGERLFRDLSESIGDSGRFLEGTVKEAMVGGKLHAVPMHSEMLIFLWNKKQFEAAGIDPEDPPDTWAGLYEYADKLRSGKRYGFASPVTGTGRSLLFFETVYNSTSGKVLSDDFKKVEFANADGLRTMETIKAGFDSGFFDPSAAAEVDDYVTAKIFEAGNSASQLNFAELWGTATDPKKSPKVADRTGWRTVPGLDSGTTGTINGFEAYGINANSDKVDAAMSFLNELASTKVQTAMTLSKVLPSSLSAVLEDPELEKTYAVGPTLAEQGSHDTARVSPPYLTDLMPIFDDVMTRLAKGGLEPQAALDEAAGRTEKLIDDYFSS